MLYRDLGRSGIKTSLLSYGTGGPNQFGKSAGLSARERKRLIGTALDLGVNLFDSASGYGGGDSERWLGEALKGFSRDSYLICTKWSSRMNGETLPDSRKLEASLERSMKRLNVDVIDVMMVHGINPEEYDVAANSYGNALLRLKEQGKVRLTGFSEMMTNDPKHTVPERALQEHPDVWDVIMLKCGILNQWAAKNVLPLATRHGVGILNMAPVRYTLTRPEEYAELLEHWRHESLIDADHPKLRDGLGWLVSDNAPSVISAGYKFAAEHPAISSVITGTSSVEHLKANAAALEVPSLPEEQLADLKNLLGDSHAPR